MVLKATAVAAVGEPGKQGGAEQGKGCGCFLETGATFDSMAFLGRGRNVASLSFLRFALSRTDLPL